MVTVHLVVAPFRGVEKLPDSEIKFETTNVLGFSSNIEALTVQDIGSVCGQG